MEEFLSVAERYPDTINNRDDVSALFEHFGGFIDWFTEGEEADITITKIEPWGRRTVVQRFVLEN